MIPLGTSGSSHWATTVLELTARPRTLIGALLGAKRTAQNTNTVEPVCSRPRHSISTNGSARVSRRVRFQRPTRHIIRSLFGDALNRLHSPTNSVKAPKDTTVQHMVADPVRCRDPPSSSVSWVVIWTLFKKHELSRRNKMMNQLTCVKYFNLIFAR